MGIEARDYKVTFEVFYAQKSKRVTRMIYDINVMRDDGRLETCTETFRAYDASDAAKMFEIHAATLRRRSSDYKYNPETREEEFISDIWLVRIEAPLLVTPVC